jgi:hypothetical protein
MSRSLPPRPALPLAALLAALAACQSAGTAPCPGAAAGTFAFAGTRNVAPDPLAPGVPACGSATGYGPALDTIAFTGTIAFEDGAAWLCTGRRHAIQLVGTRSGAEVEVETTTTGAVLSACGASCEATVTAILRGTVGAAADGTPTFTGTWIERLAADPGAKKPSSCGACTLPCDGRYDVAGTAVP